VIEALHRRALSDHLVSAALLAQRLELLDGVFQRERVPQRDQQPIPTDGLFQEIARPQAGGLHGRLDGPVPRHHQHRKARARLEQLLEDGEPVHVRQLDVQEHGVDRPCERNLQPELPGPGQLGVVARQLQRLAEREEDVLLVVDEEDAVGHHRTPGRGR
jgi:hypothetical protein